ncbi:hypothetical protein FOMPIDRAFT_1063211 [Fomitopsis schrenkii]|uniref:Uncharacterized protein n=1 Tax=Fomitopsis schrenkii TaxID=2126942 RepID=S8DT39_FOMSC|nr:hypothetical protein FOMPIDRAFT_1063211 [Fomitopsis schrenkii]
MASREALEQRNAHSRECTPAANTQLNALAPVSRLPPEVLSEVFLQHVRHCDDPVGPHYRRSSGVPVGRWIRVTHVCTYWRETALECAMLWSHLEAPACPDLLAELLVRSKDVPLSMALTFCATRQTHSGHLEPSEDTLLLALSALHRVKTLYVYARWDYRATDPVLQRLGSGAPLLESLTIIGAPNNSGLADLYSSISSLLSHPEARPLSTLVSVHSHFTWGKIPFDGLARLDISGTCNPSQSGTKSFLTALGHMPCLEELKLKGFFTRNLRAAMWSLPGSAIPSFPALIALPRLRRLWVHQEIAHTTTTFLNSLRTPSLSHLSVDAFPSGLKDDFLLFEAMAQKAATLGRFMTVSLWLHQLYTSHETHFRAYRDVCQRTTDPKDDSTSVWLQRHVPVLEYHGRNNIPDTLPLTKFFQTLPVGYAQSLILGGQFPTSDEWLGLTRCMETVIELRLHHITGDASAPCNALSLRAQQDTGDARAPFVLPNLRTLTMDEFNFEGCLPMSLAEHLTRGLVGIIPKLQACFARRAEEGQGIKILRILSAWELWIDDLERLREAVPCVESDGILESFFSCFEA